MGKMLCGSLTIRYWARRYARSVHEATIVSEEVVIADVAGEGTCAHCRDALQEEHRQDGAE